MVGNVEFIVVNRHSFVRAALRECFRKPRGTKMIRFPPSPGDHLAAPTTKSAHLLRLTRHPQPYPRFEQNRRRSTCGFVFVFRHGREQAAKRSRWADFVAPPRTKAPPRRREMSPWRLGVGWGLCFGSPPAARGLLAPGAVSTPSAYGYPRLGLRRRPWR